MPKRYRGVQKFEEMVRGQHFIVRIVEDTLILGSLCIYRLVIL